MSDKVSDAIRAITKARGLIDKRLSGALPLALAISAYGSSADETFSIEEIIVTAQKREENAQDIAVSVSAISGDIIQSSALNSLKDVGELLPGVTFSDRNDPRTLGFFIRGIGSQQTHIGVEPSSAVVVDGEVMARSSSLHGDIGDVANIQVLKGPQGTLFGKNTVAGALVVNTNRPSLEGNSGTLSVSGAEGVSSTIGEYNLKGTYNFVLGDNAALRVNAFQKEQDGWIENVLDGGPNGGESDSKGVRGQMLYRFDNGIDLLWRADYSKQNFGPGIRVYRQIDRPIIPEEDLALLTPEQREAVKVTRLHELSKTPEGEWNDKTSAWNNRDYGDMTNTGTSFELNYTTANNYDLTYQLFYRDYEMWTNESVASVAVNTSPYSWAGGVGSQSIQNEFRITSPQGGFMDYVAGAFYYHAEIERDQKTLFCNDPGLENSLIDEQTLQVLECNGSVFDFYTRSAGSDQENQWVGSITNRELKNNIITHDNVALFGQANLHFSEHWMGVIGARILHEKQDFTIDVREEELSPESAFVTLEKDNSDTAFVYKLALQYSPIEELMTYISYSTGYKGVAWWTATDLSQEELDGQYPLDPEESTNIEWGVRSDWFDGRLRLNATLFWAEYEHYQDRVRYLDYGLSPDEIPVLNFELIDAGLLESKGLDFEFIWAITKNLKLSGSYNYLEAKFTDTDAMIVCPGGDIADQCTETMEYRTGRDFGRVRSAELLSLEGLRLADAPEEQINMDLTYYYHIGGWGSYIRANYRWRSELSSVHGGVEADSDTNTPAFGITNLYLNFSSPSDKYNVNLFVKNLFDKHYYTRVTNYGDGQMDLAIGSYYVTVPELDGHGLDGAGLYPRTSPVAGNVPRDFNRYYGASFTMKF